jgi:hypothetical protein
VTARRRCSILPAHATELNADVVVVQGEGKNTLQLFGTPYSVSRVRAAVFNAAVSWTPLDFA